MKGVDRNGKRLPEGITQRADGRYMGRFQYGGERYTVYDTDLREIKKKLTSLKYEVENGLFAKQDNITVPGGLRYGWKNIKSLLSNKVQ